MRVQVIRAFVDKKTGQGYNAGSQYETEDAARVTELHMQGFTAAPATVNKAPAKRTARTRKAATE